MSSKRGWLVLVTYLLLLYPFIVLLSVGLFEQAFTAAPSKRVVSVPDVREEVFCVVGGPTFCIEVSIRRLVLDGLDGLLLCTKMPE